MENGSRVRNLKQEEKGNKKKEENLRGEVSEESAWERDGSHFQGGVDRKDIKIKT